MRYELTIKFIDESYDFVNTSISPFLSIFLRARNFISRELKLALVHVRVIKDRQARYLFVFIPREIN